MKKEEEVEEQGVTQKSQFIHYHLQGVSAGDFWTASRQVFVRVAPTSQEASSQRAPDG